VSGKAYVGPEVDVWSCGVVLYALLCGSLPFDDENVPNLFRKIKHGNFTLPGHLSSEAKDLIVQMLVVDPTRRITFAQIRKHTWFVKDLPEYLAAGQLLRTGLEKLVYNPEIIAQLEDIGMKIEDQENLKPDEQVAYQLLADRASKQSSFTNLLAEDMRRGFNVPGLFDDEDVQQVAMQFHQESGVPQYKLTPVAGERSVIISQAQLSASDCPWQIGMEVSMEGATLMTEVLHAIQDLGYEWYNITPWRVRAQPVRLEGQLKIVLTIQIYKAASSRYLLDVMLSQGPSLLALHAALQFLRHLASYEAVAPCILDKSNGFFTLRGQRVHSKSEDSR
jgi:5'-AMP-activated protein kinase catalytic alpha subunit